MGCKSINVTFTSIDKHLSSKNFAHLGKSVQLLLNQVQKYVYDYNMGKMGNAEESEKDFLSDSFKNYEWNFPGLRKNLPANMEEEIKSLDQDGMKELVLLQQRTVLQVPYHFSISLDFIQDFIFYSNSFFLLTEYWNNHEKIRETSIWRDLKKPWKLSFMIFLNSWDFNLTRFLKKIVKLYFDEIFEEFMMLHFDKIFWQIRETLFWRDFCFNFFLGFQ